MTSCAGADRAGNRPCAFDEDACASSCIGRGSRPTSSRSARLRGVPRQAGMTCPEELTAHVNNLTAAEAEVTRLETLVDEASQERKDAPAKPESPTRARRSSLTSRRPVVVRRQRTYRAPAGHVASAQWTRGRARTRARRSCSSRTDRRSRPRRSPRAPAAVSRRDRRHEHLRRASVTARSAAHSRTPPRCLPDVAHVNALITAAGVADPRDHTPAARTARILRRRRGR